MRKSIIRSILKRIQDGSIPKEAGVDLCFEIRDLEMRTAAGAKGSAVAIIGLAGRYPQARNVDELWKLLKEGRDAVTEIPTDRWDWRAYHQADPEEAAQEGRSYCRWGGFIDGYDEFDPFFFNLSPRETGYMDPQERLFLEVAWETLEDAGYTRDALGQIKATRPEFRVGVFVGATWQEGQLFSDPSQERGGPIFSTHAYNIANRISYFCGFEGPSLTLDTACSSSLTALHLAWENIVRGQADLALAGGVNLSIHPNKFLVLSGAGFASKSGCCQSFGKGADGYVPAEAVGALLLKPLAQAIADGDHIYGVIKGSAINHGGKTNGYTVPSPAAQARVVIEALRQAGVDPKAVSYIEAHGTGTALGDPIEIAGLEKVFGDGNQAKPFCAIGSIKSNLGHGEAAAGIAGVTKVLLQMAHRQLVPTLHAEELNPRIDFERSPFRAQRRLEEWKRPLLPNDGQWREGPRIAGVSSFGAGGANAHLVIEEAPEDLMQDCQFDPAAPFLVVLSARNKERLAVLIERLHSYVAKAADRSPSHLANLAYTLQVGRDALEERLAFLAINMDEVQEKLRQACAVPEGGEGLFRGRVSRGNTAIQKLEGAGFRQRPASAQEWEALLIHWVRGGPVDWKALHQHEFLRRIRLPAYPFARERYPLMALDPAESNPQISPTGSYSDRRARTAGDELSALPGRIVQATSGPVPSGLLKNHSAPPIPLSVMSDQNEWARIEEWLAKLLLVQVRRMGALNHPGELKTGPAWMAQAGISAKYQRWWETCCLPALEARRLIRQCGGFFALEDTGQEEAGAAWADWDRQKAAWGQGPGLKGGIELVDACLRQLPAILRGEIPATDILFPQSSLQSVENLYQGNPVADFCNATLAEVVADYCGARIQKDGSSKLRIIEIGAGTGATTTAVLSRLKPYTTWIERYDYTDLSKAFLLHAEDRFQPEFHFVKPALCNIEVPPGEQGFAPGSYDIVIASNVLHATANLGVTLRQAKSLLKPHGLLALNEATQKSLLGCLTFGLLDGWWLFEDEPWRIPGSPLLDPPRWRRILAQTGFINVLIPWEQSEPIGQHVILAESEGLSEGDVPAKLATDSSPAECGLPTARTNDETPRAEADLGSPSRGIAKERPGASVRPEGEEIAEPPDVGSYRIGKGGDLARRVTAVILRHMSSTLRTSVEKIDPETPFADYGLDSILGVGFISSLNQEFGISLNAAIIFDYTSVDRLARYLLETCRAELAASFHTSEPVVAPEPVVTPAVAQSRSSSKVAVMPRTDSGPSRIAIIGLSCQVPGAATADGFWENLLAGRDGVGELPPAYLQGVEDGKPLYRWGGTLANRDGFDSLFFSISPKEAEAMHPHQRLVLQEGWRALEDAGLNPRSLAGSRTGIYVGAEPTGQITPSFTGSSEALIASRLSYFLNLKGPALVVNTGCSSSAAAIHLACESLRHQQSDLTLACGVFAAMNQPGLSVLADIGMLSPSGQCRTFDAAADGTVLSEGVGVVVLKRLEEALADGDPIYGVIVGSGMNQDGASNGITAPNGASQESLILDVYRRFKIDPEHIGYLETHGTGTRLGDPVEANALVRAFAAFTQKQHFCAIGSAKAHIGHTSAAAGVIGLIRILLSMRAGRIPALPHFQSLNPLIEFEKSPFHINTQTMEWKRDDGQPRVAALNAFGHSGTNVHLVVQEHVPSSPAPPPPAGPFLAVLSARTPDRLADAARQLLDFAHHHPEVELADLCFTLQTGREAMNERLALVVDCREVLRGKLAAFLAGQAQVENLFRGSARSHREALASFLEDEDALRVIDTWMAKRKFNLLLDVWVKGFPIDWKRLYRGAWPRRIHYPAYPFAPERYPMPTFPGDTGQVPLCKALTPDASLKEKAEAAKVASAPSPCLAGPVPTAGAGWDGLSFLPCWEPRSARPAPLKPPQSVLLAFHPSSCGFERGFIDEIRRRFPSASLLTCDLSREPAELAASFETLPPVDCFYFLSLPRTRPDPFTLSDLEVSLQGREMALLRLLKVLKQKISRMASVDVYLLTAGNHGTGAGEAMPAGGGVAGLAYALAQSDHRFRVRHIDLSWADLESIERPGRLIDQICAEEASARGEVVRFKGGLRYTRTFRRWQWGQWELGSGLRQGGVYVILGGSGVVGGIITRHLMERHGARVVWLGRRSRKEAGVQSRLEACAVEGRLPDYCEADATQPQSLQQAVRQIKQSFGPIHGAIFAGLIFDPNNSLDFTTEETFARIVNLKAKGGYNFYEALKDEDLDFLCYFSSVQAFPFLTARDSCAYAAGITAADTLARFLGLKARFPVGIINWGYWRRSVSGTELEGRLAGHFGFISDPAGSAWFEKFTHLLRNRVLDQMVCLGASERVQALMACPPDEALWAQAESAGPLPAGWFQDEPRRLEEIDRLRQANPLPAFEPWLVRLLEAQLCRISAVTTEGHLKSAGEMQSAGALIERYACWWEECRSLLGMDQGGTVTVMNPDDVWGQWHQEKKVFLDHPDLRGAVELAERCLHSLPGVLNGEVAATDILFPKSSLLQVESLHRGNTLADYLNGLMGDVLVRSIQQRSQSNPGATFRILEAGAGTGGTTGLVLPALSGCAGKITEYRYTDISKAFLVHGEKQFSTDHPFLAFSLWDIETPPDATWVGRYDAVIGTNVIHATRDIRQSLRNLKTVLKRHGLLILNEGVEKSILGTLTFGLLEGWWRFQDRDLRLCGAPLLASETWNSVLAEEGYTSILMPAAAVRRLGHQVIVAQSDGIVPGRMISDAVHPVAGTETGARGTVAPACNRPGPLIPGALPHLSDSPSTSPPQPPRSGNPRDCEQPAGLTPEMDRREQVAAILGQALAESLNLPPATIDRECSLADYGVDSILGIGFIDLVNARLGIHLGAAIIFDYSTLHQLADHILRAFPRVLSKTEAEAGVSAAPVQPSPPPEPETAKSAKPPLTEAASTAMPGKSNDPSLSPIAVIGMSGQFPGAEDTRRFWKNLVEGIDGITVLPDRYSKEELFKLAGHPSGYRWGGILEGRDHFDPLFFRISPREAESMSPHQRLVLQEGWKSLEDAGYNPRGLRQHRAGVFIGAEPAGYFHESFTGSSDAIVASRLSYHLNFRGPALVVNTGCSSSAVAIHLACESLRRRETDLALAGGVCATVGPSGLGVLSDSGMLSPTGQCHSLDASANGTVLSEGVGMVVLKRLDDALADGDPIYGIIQASGMNQDGASNGITAPNGIAQEALMAEVYRRFDINPEDICYVETHGTGTRLGDPVEVNALVRAFRQFTRKTHFCALGSAKAHIGHTSAASGVIGLIKVLLSFQHRSIPPLLHFQSINPLCEIAGSAFFVNQSPLDLEESREHPRLAALNSFGHSGTNVHLVAREYREGRPPYLGSKPVQPQLVVLSAQTPERLEVMAGNLDEFLLNHPETPLAELACTLQLGRDSMSERVALIAQDIPDLRDKLRAFLAGAAPGVVFWKGRVEEDSPAIKLLASDSDTRELISKWLKAGKLDKLAEFWTQGIDLDWKLLYGSSVPPRLHLPTYPFVRNSYWVSAAAQAVQAPPPAVLLHPLVHENRSSFSRQRFFSRFSGREFFLTDHQVKGIRVLPGVAYLEMARAAVERALAGEEASPGPAGGRTTAVLRNVVWLRPLCFKESSLEVSIELTRNSSGGIDFEVQSPQGAEEKTVFCQGSAAFESVAEPPALNLAELQEGIRPHHYTANQCYERFRQLGIAYGAGHRGLEALFAGEGQLLARVSLPSAISETRDQYYLHPALLDAALQGFIGFMMPPGEEGSFSSAKPSLPFALERFEVFAPCPCSMWAWIRSSAGSAPDSPVAKFDIDFCDTQGKVCARMRRFSTRVLEEGLASSPAATLLTLSPVWKVVPPPGGKPIEPPPGARLVVIGGDDSEKQQLRELYPGALFLAPEGDLLKRQIAAAGRIDHVLWMARRESLESLVSERLVAGQADGVIQVFDLVKLLLGLGWGDRDLAWTFITRQTHAVLPGDIAQPLHASVHGFAGSLAKEYPHWKIRLLDMPDGVGWPWPALLQMPFHPEGNAWFYRHEQWFERSLVAVRELPPGKPLYRRNGVYVVIGGAGGIGEAWTRYMIENYQAAVYWIGRRALGEGIQERLDRLAHLHPRPEYIPANAADLPALQSAYARIKERHGVIHGVVHSAIVLLDKSLAKMDEARFRAGLEAKIDASVRLAQVFGNEPLDFMLFFSSLQSFSKGPGQSNYAAGCAFKDALACALGKERNYPVKIMNWGYWGSLGIVKDAAYHQRMARDGMGSIEPQEGMKALESLMNGPLDQLAVSKILEAAPSGHSSTGPEWMTVYARPDQPLDWSFLEHSLPSSTESALPRLEELEPVEMEQTLLGLLWAGLEAAGLFQGAALDRSKVLGKYQAWLEQSLAWLESKGWLARPETAPRPAVSWDAWQQAGNGWMRDERLAAQLTLLETCLRALPDILTGKRKATDVLFPASSTGLVEGVYRGNPVADFFNEQLTEAVVAYVKARIARDSAARLRILEAGAGTGGTSAGLLARLQPFASNLAEYCYTDISKSFLFHAEKHFVPSCPFVTTRLFDVSQPLAGQGISLDAFDVCVATNVLHATADIRLTLRNIKAALHRDGLLVVNELCRSSLFAHLTFGLLDGWWLYQDAALRIRGCPGLSPETWRRVLEEEGFENVTFPARHRHELGQQLIVASSDGVVRQRCAQPAPAPALPSSAQPEASQSLGETLRERAVAWTKRLLATELRMSAEQLDAAKPLEVYGMDSILVVHLTNALRTRFADITSTLFFEVQTIDALVDHLLKHQKEAVMRNVGWAASPASSEGGGQNNGIAHPTVSEPAMPALAAYTSGNSGVTAVGGGEIGPVPESPRATQTGNLSLKAETSPWASVDRDIAIIGLSVRFPQARHLEEFWANLKEGRNCITEIPKERWDWSLHYHEEAGRRGSYYSKWGGFISEADCFDPAFFQISPREAHRMDPQERIFLEAAYACIEDAGYTPGTLCPSRRVGVFVGVMNSTYHPLPNYASIANRVSYQLDLQGPSLAVDTACSASLTAIHLAVESLHSGTSLCAIAGGVNLNLSPLHYLRLSEARMLSPGGACKPFGSEADGMVDGEGVGAVLLKPLAKALQDGDHIYGVIKAGSVNAGGKTNGYTVPNPIAQARLVADTLDQAGIPPRTISCIEAHGTGTVLGDPIEIAGLTRAFQEVSKNPTADRQFCAIGSVKSNIGHCESAAGMAGLAKVLLQLKHGCLVPSLHAETTNPNIDFTRTPFVVQRKLEEWKRPVLEDRTHPRRAGISSFGAGGANAHMVIEEAPLTPAASSSLEALGGQAAIVLSARNADRLLEVVRQLAHFLENHPDVSLVDLAYTLQVGRESKEHRLGLSVCSTSELREKLQRWLQGDANIDGLYRGDPGAAREGLLLLGADEEIREAVAKWMARRKINRLLEVWVKGLAVDWSGLYAGQRPSRLSLPTYPFARERYWHVESGASLIQVSSSVAGLTADTHAPLSNAVQLSNGSLPGADISAGRMDETVLDSSRGLQVGKPALQAEADLERELAASLAEALLLKPELIDPGKPFVELGLDSIIGVEWIQVLNQVFGLRLTVTKLYDHPNLRQWTAFIREQVKNLPPTNPPLGSASFPACRVAGFPVGKADNTSVAFDDSPNLQAESLSSTDSAETSPKKNEPACPASLGIRENLMASLAATLMMAPAALDPAKSFVDLGLDSILGVEWIKALNQRYGLRLTVSAIYDHPSLDAFAAWMQSEFKLAAVPREEPPPCASAMTPPRQIAPLQRSVETVAAPRPTAPSSGRIAIIGMSGRYPQADDLDQYWKNLVEGRHSIREIPPSRWDTARYYHPDPSHPGTIYCKFLGMLEDVDCFDPLFFMISPDEAEGMDPQHRLFLQEGYRAFENAGYCLRTLDQVSCGVYLGIMSNEYGAMLLQRPEGRSLAGNSFAMAPARLSYFLNLKGPAIPVDTACSSSLVAIHLACQALLNHEIDLALAGGVSLYLRPEFYLGMCAAGMLAADGRCKPFDAAADGFIPGEGVGAVVLKRLEEAEADGDLIHGVILGSAINQDGKTNGITAPSMTSQIDLVRGLYLRRGIDPSSIGYVEMHGTGTKLGDPIELEALAAVYRQADTRRPLCAIGSVKSNIGHTSAAAGVAGLHKVLLCLKHGTLVPTLHFQKPNPHFDFESAPFYVNTRVHPWPNPNGPARRAAVSSFGFSGTNAHLVIEEYTRRAPVAPAPERVVIPLSAKTPDALRAMARRLRGFLQDHRAENPELNLAGLAYTLQVGRDAFEERAAFVVSSWRELEDNLRVIADGSMDGAKIHRGRVKADRMPPSTPLSVSSESEPCDQLAPLWTAGQEVDWRRLYESSGFPVKMSLPGYPFARERYWISISAELHQDPVRPEMLHPLLHRRVSEGGSEHFISAFSGHEFFLQGHVVNGKKILSGSCCLEMVRAAWDCLKLDPGHGLRFEEVVWPFPMTVAREGREARLTLELRNGGARSFEITTRSAEGREPTVHARGVVLAGTTDYQPTLDLATLTVLTSQQPFKRESCYAAFRELGIEYGAEFQGIDRLHCGPKHVLARLTGPASGDAASRSLVLHPAILDSALQSAIGFALATASSQAADRSDHSSLSPQVPFSIESMEIWAPVENARWAWIRFSPESPAEAANSRLDMDVCDEQGRVSIRIRGYSFRAMDGNTPPPEIGLWRPEWRTAELPLTGLPAESDFGKVEQASSLGPNRPLLLGGQDVCPTFPTHPEGSLREVIVHQLPLEAVGPMADLAIRLDLETGGPSPEARLSAALTLIFQRVKQLVQRAGRQEALLQVLSRPAEGGVSLACLSGLFKTLALEHPQIHGQLIEVDERTPENVMPGILNANAACPDHIHIRYESGQRKLLSWVPMREEREVIPWKDGGVYLLTGGAGALGLFFAREIASRCNAPTIVLAGRSPLRPEQTEIIRNISQEGARVEYRQLDVCNSSAVESFVQDLVARYGRLNGILHGAALTRDRLLSHKTSQDFQSVLAPKLAGALNLDRATRSLDLDLFVLFSSTGGVTGNLGQADYCAANAFLDCFADDRARLVKRGQRQGRTLSINWPLWKDGGLSVESGTAAAIQSLTGMVPMSTEAGIKLFYRSLASGESQVLAMQGDCRQFDRFLRNWPPADQTPAGAVSSQWQHGTLGHPNQRPDRGGDVSSPQGAVEVDPCGDETSPPLCQCWSERFSPDKTGDEPGLLEAIEYLTEVVAASLKMAPDRLDPDEALDHYGIDSIKGLQVIRNLEPFFGALPKTLFFECQTVRDLARHFLSAHAETMRGLIGKCQARPPAPEQRGACGMTARPASAPEEAPGQAAESRATSSPGALDIAIIGLSGRYPQARNLEEFWTNLREGKDCVTEIPADRWDWRAYYSADKGEPGKYYSNRGGFIPDADKFDAQFFNISPREAEYIDPQERLFLEHAWMAMEDAGYAPSDPRGRVFQPPSPRVGVYVGVMYGEFQLLSGGAGGAAKGLALGSSFANIANRVSYALDLHGPSLAMDTMCSSSLTCLHLACQDLKHGKTDLAIAGGVNLNLHPNKYLLLSSAQFLSEKGRCESFGSGADGYIPGEGVGAVILKRLAEAERDGDYIYGVIKGSAINHGGRSSGYSVPNPQAQAEVVSQAIQESGLDPAWISYLEAHGTGTSLGDPIEIAGLAKVFGSSPEGRPACWLGSVKSNLGHCEAAAGLAGLTKILLQLKHRQMVPSLHARILNPKIDFQTTPFALNRDLRNWDRPVVNGKPVLRAAGLSSFGAGGSNAHLVIQEYDGPSLVQRRSPDSSGPCLIVLSAKNGSRLQEKMSELRRFLRTSPEIRLRDLAYTLQAGRKAMEHRMAFTANSLPDLEHKLDAILSRQSLEGVCQGEFKYHKQNPAAIQADEEMRSGLRTWIERGELIKLAELWVKGHPLDWNLLYRDSRPFRVPLPTYPFARNRYWIETVAASSSSAEAPDAPIGRKGNGDWDESFHSQMLDRLASGEMDIEEAIQTMRKREHAD